MVIVGSSGSRASVRDSFSKKLLERPITREVLIGMKTRGLRRRLWYSTLSDGEGFGGPDYTMGGQSAKRTDDGDVVADTGEAGAGTGDRYGTGPGQGKKTGVAG